MELGERLAELLHGGVRHGAERSSRLTPDVSYERKRRFETGHAVLAGHQTRKRGQRPLELSRLRQPTRLYQTVELDTQVRHDAGHRLTAAVIVGGIRRIGDVTQVMVPFMSVMYVTGGLVILIANASAIPSALRLVFEGAFTGTAATGGFAGSTVALALRHGVARGLFSNEAGLGSAPMVHAAATTDHPVRQGLYGIFEVFVDTLVVCSVTGLAILVTGVWDGGATGAAMSGEAFRQGLPSSWGDVLVTASVVLFAFSTIIGWSYYGETAIVYLVGTRGAVPYRLVWLVFIYLGATGSLQLIWNIADTLNGLMAIPNLVSVLASIPLLLRLQREFFAQPRQKTASFFSG